MPGTPRSASCVQRRERIAAGIAQIRIRPAAGRIRDRDLRAPRRVVGEARVEEQVRRIVEDALRGTDARPPVAARSPDGANARRELGELAVRRRLARVVRRHRGRSARPAPADRRVLLRP